MTKKEAIKLFEERKVRTVWDDELEKWYFSIVDVIGVLTDSVDSRKYWNKLKQRLKEEGNETVTNCHQLKLVDPELTIDRAMWEYKRLGYSDSWINQRLKSIEIRKNLTDEWKRCGMEEGVQFASLTDIITKTWSDKTTKEYKAYKGLKKENLRDNMTNTELILNMLAEASTTELSQVKNPQNFDENASVAMEGGKVAKVARQQLESQLGRSVVSPLNAHSTLEKLPEDTEKDE